MQDSSADKDKREPKQSQESSVEAHSGDVHSRVPADGYIILHRRILDEGFSALELSFIVTCLLIAAHRKSKTPAPGIVNKSTIEIGWLMGASQKTAWRCRMCGHVHYGDEPPEECPYCFFEASAFTRI